MNSSQYIDLISRKIDLISEYVKSVWFKYSISMVGYDYYITFGEIAAINNPNIPIPAGIHNYIKLLSDGSVHARVLLTGDGNSNYVDIGGLSILCVNVFPEIYKKFIGENFEKHFISAYKYEKMTVFKQFVPIYASDKAYSFDLLSKHREKYGNNLILESSRNPVNEYEVIDKRWFNNLNIKYNFENLVHYLFSPYIGIFGYIDMLKK